MSKIKKMGILAMNAVSHPEKIAKGVKVLKQEGMGSLKEKMKHQVNRSMQLQVDSGEAAIMNAAAYSDIKISVIMPTYNVEIKWLEKAIRSVTQQVHPNWELCIADDCSTDKRVPEYLSQLTDPRIKVVLLDQNVGISDATNAAAELATGEYMALMDNDDALTPNALYEIAACIKKNHSDIIYSDHDIIDENDQHQQPLLKPSWSPDLMRCQMYVGHLLAFKSELYRSVGGLRKEFNGSQDYDLMLRMMEQAERIDHVEKILYSWRSLPTSTATNPDSKPYAQTAGLNAIQAHLDRVYGEGKATVAETKDYYVYDVRYPVEQKPLVSLIIPIRDHIDYLQKLVASIDAKTAYPNYEYVILNNNSEEQATFDYLKELEKRDNAKVVDAPIEFNWSKLNNLGIEHASGDVFLFMNNDMEVITEDWLDRLVENALREEVGVVGPLLLYEDGTIQHAGVVVGIGGWADHIFKGMNPVHYGSPFLSPMVTRNVLAVTGACMAISRKTIQEIGTFNEDFQICGSDIEMCIRAYEHGLYNVYTPFVRLYHYESKSRSSYIPKIDFEMSAKVYKPYLGKDPFYNGQLDYSQSKPTADPVKSAVYTLSQPKKKKKMKLRETLATAAAPDNSYSIPEIGPYSLRPVNYARKRMNLLVPSVNAEHVFGGISTALKFFEYLCQATGYDRRIILTDAAPHKEEIKKYQGLGYSLVDCMEDSDATSQLVPYSDRYQKSIPVSENDYFMMTGWWTAHCIQEAYMMQEGQSGLTPNKFLYFIQDYEPGFYPWSSQYLLADATYRCKYDQIAVFNTSLLQNYMKQLGYQFYREYAFEPVLNDGLKKCLDQVANQDIRKKKQILLYGRPGTKRNAFELIVTALRKWVWMQPDVEEWKILSAGEAFDPVYLGNGKKIESVGKLSIEEYGQTLQESYAGISLMVSPHPSYPPLEMATFGVKVLTNTYANKDWKDFSENVVVVEQVTALGIARQLTEICNGYQETVHLTVPDSDYLNNQDVFSFVNQIKEDL
ncbi:MAG: glycosyltransferase [Roseburia sp.]